MWERTVRVGGAILLAFVLALAAGGCTPKGSGAPTARAAARAFVEGVLQDDAAQVSKAAGSPVTESKMRYLRRQWTGSADALHDTSAVLGASQDESLAATFIFESYVVDKKAHAALGSDDVAAVLVSKKNGWHATVAYLLK